MHSRYWRKDALSLTLTVSDQSFVQHCQTSRATFLNLVTSSVASGHPPLLDFGFDLEDDSQEQRSKATASLILDPKNRGWYFRWGTILKAWNTLITLWTLFCKWWCFVLTEFLDFCSFRIQKWRKKEVMQYKDRHSWNVWFCWSILENQVSSYLTTAHIYSRNTREARKWILS